MFVQTINTIVTLMRIAQRLIRMQKVLLVPAKMDTRTRFTKPMVNCVTTTGTDFQKLRKVHSRRLTFRYGNDLKKSS